jgi:hypothetical protein
MFGLTGQISRECETSPACTPQSYMHHLQAALRLKATDRTVVPIALSLTVVPIALSLTVHVCRSHMSYDVVACITAAEDPLEVLTLRHGTTESTV